MNIKAVNIRLIFLFLTLCILSTGCGLGRHPSDEVLEQQLKSREKEFTRLATMLNEDLNVVRLSDEDVFLNDNSKPAPSQERLAEYRHLFRELKLEKGIHRDNANQVRLIASSKGLLVASSEKSFMYSSENPSPLVDSIDAIVSKAHANQDPVYKRLGGNWYIYYESW
jgi:hypothetical protein